MNDEEIGAAAAEARLNAKERLVFETIAKGEGTVVERILLQSKLSPLAPRTLDTQIKNIRQKLRNAGIDGELVTIARSGYVWRSGGRSHHPLK